MSPKTALLALACATLLAQAACGPRHGGSTSEQIGPPPRPRILRSEPGCAYRVVGTISIRTPTTAVPGTEIVRQARAMGAYAVVPLSFTRDYDNGRPAGGQWTGHAIVFSNPTPACFE